MALGVPEFRRVLLKLGAALDSDIGKLAVALATQDRASALGIVTDAYPELASPYLAAAGDLTATWYEDQPAKRGAPAFTALPAELPAVEQLAANGRWAMVQPKPTTALKGAGRRQLFKAHRDTVISNANRERVGWVREARPGACGFCRMQATRILTEGAGGAPGLYVTEQTAEASFHTEDTKGHDHCRCIAVPLRGGKPYTIPGYVHDWLDDYEAVSRDESGRLLSVSRIVALMEQRGALRGDPVDYDDEHQDDKRPAIVDLDAKPAKQPKPAPESKTDVASRHLPMLESNLANLRATGHGEDSGPVKYHLQQIERLRRELGLPSGPRAPLALPAGKSAGRLAIEAPAAQKAAVRAPIALGTGRTPKMLTAGPTRLAIEAPKVKAPDPNAIAEWLVAENKHRDALEYWREVEDEPLPPADAIADVAPAQRTRGDALRDAIIAAEAAFEEPDERRSATAKQKQQRRDARRLALTAARRDLEQAEADGTAADVIVEKPKRAKARPASEVEADRIAKYNADMDAAVAAFEDACATGDDAAIEAATDHMEVVEQEHVDALARYEAEAAKIAAKSDQQRARREAARLAEQEEIGRLIEEGGYEPEQAEAEVVAKRTGKSESQVLEQIRKREFIREAAADGIHGKGFDDVLDAVFRLKVEILYMEAEEATNGYMVKKPHSTKFNPKNLWYCNDATARKVMTEEMANWFDANGRITRPVMRAMILDGDTNFARRTVMDEDYNQ